MGGASWESCPICSCGHKQWVGQCLINVSFIWILLVHLHLPVSCDCRRRISVNPWGCLPSWAMTGPSLSSWTSQNRGSTSPREPTSPRRRPAKYLPISKPTVWSLSLSEAEKKTIFSKYSSQKKARFDSCCEALYDIPGKSIVICRLWNSNWF